MAEKLQLLNRVKEIYANNGNIMNYLSGTDNERQNTLEDILISYDFQAGSHIRHYRDNGDGKNKFCDYLAGLIDRLGPAETLLEVGVGEAVTMGNLLLRLSDPPQRCYGFDIAWSRLKYAACYLQELRVDRVKLFAGDLFCTPLKDDSIDIVYTVHSIEANSGREKEALSELYRITNKYLILLEPLYELASDEAKARMKRNGYVTGLYDAAVELGYDIVEHRLFEVTENPLNPTGLLVIRKQSGQKPAEPLCCPLTKGDIYEKNNAYFSEQSLLAYPVIDGIPCLMPHNAIVATHFLDEVAVARQLFQ